MMDGRKGTLAGGAYANEAADATPWGKPQEEWLRTYVDGASRERLAAEVERLLGLYNGADLLRIITAIKKRLPARKRVRSNKPQMDWSSPKGVQTRAELWALLEGKGFSSQLAACQWWQEWALSMGRHDLPAVNMNPDDLKKAVFARAQNPLGTN